MRSNLNFINITSDISDANLIELIRKYPDSPILCDKEFMNRVNELKSKIEN